MSEIQKADPRARRKALLFLGIGTLLGAAAISLAELYGPAVIEWIARDPERMDSRVRIGGVVVAVALEVPLLGFAAYLWRLGARIIRTGRFPAPGVAVARDTVVLRGGEARRRG